MTEYKKIHIFHSSNELRAQLQLWYSQRLSFSARSNATSDNGNATFRSNAVAHAFATDYKHLSHPIENTKQRHPGPWPLPRRRRLAVPVCPNILRSSIQKFTPALTLLFSRLHLQLPRLLLKLLQYLWQRPCSYSSFLSYLFVAIPNFEFEDFLGCR